MKNKTIVLLSTYLLASILTYGHAFKQASMSCHENAKNAKNENYLMFCTADVPIVALFNSLAHPLYWSYQMHK